MKRLLKSIGLRQSQPTLPISTNVLPTPSFQPYDASTAEKFCYRQHRGVNLGGMFVLEAWLCPDHLRNAVKNGQWQSEMDFLLACESNSQARELLEYHWSSFITPKDIGEMAAAGINAVRIPIGYYIVHPRDMLTGQHKDDAYFRFADVYDAAMGYLLRLVHECEKHGIGVLIDIHAAPGGQNASDHCGMAMPCRPHFFSSRRCQNYMLAILAKLVQLFSPLNHVIGIGLLNEPIDDPGLMAYYQTACDTVLKNTPNGQRALPLYLGDAWNAYKYMDRISQQLLPRYPFVVLETHAYFCHTPQDHQQVAQQHMANAEKMANSLQDRGKVVRNNVSVGEWAMVLNGQSMTGMDERQTMAQFGQWQLQLYDKATAAHFYWTYKTADDKWYWSLKYCIEQGLISYKTNENTRPKPANELDQAIVQQFAAKRMQAGSADMSAQQPIYEKGFQDGYRVAITQFYPAPIGFKSQLAHDHKTAWAATSNDAQQQQKQQQHAWLYDQGFVDGIDYTYKLD